MDGDRSAGLDTTVAVYNLDTSKRPDPGLFRIDYHAQYRASYIRNQRSVISASGIRPPHS